MRLKQFSLICSGACGMDFTKMFYHQAVRTTPVFLMKETIYNSICMQAKFLVFDLDKIVLASVDLSYLFHFIQKQLT